MTVISTEDFFLSEFSVLRDINFKSATSRFSIVKANLQALFYLYFMFSFFKYFFKPVGSTKSKNKTPYEINW